MDERLRAMTRFPGLAEMAWEVWQKDEGLRTDRRYFWMSYAKALEIELTKKQPRKEAA